MQQNCAAGKMYSILINEDSSSMLRDILIVQANKYNIK